MPSTQPLEEANQQRAEKAAVRQSFDVAMALDHLDKIDVPVPAHIQRAAALRLRYPTLSLRELADLDSISKDAMRSRLRQLVLFADARREA